MTEQASVQQDQVDQLIKLIADLVDTDPCWYDHHGYCQAHFWMATEPRCPHARAMEIPEVAATLEEED
ncbi:hypothetical protein ACPB9J_33130 [Streptomyces lavendulocolor]|uniref:hypothetical protein n=1 Tax=Streptomyces lavendulocolor TaxID=67316 RepID=UPI003C2BB41E